MKRANKKFKKELKDEFLQGVRVNYQCEKIGICKSYMSSILNGKVLVDDFLINKMLEARGNKKQEFNNLSEHFFEKE